MAVRRGVRGVARNRRRRDRPVSRRADSRARHCTAAPPEPRRISARGILPEHRGDGKQKGPALALLTLIGPHDPRGQDRRDNRAAVVAMRPVGGRLVRTECRPVERTRSAHITRRCRCQRFDEEEMNLLRSPDVTAGGVGDDARRNSAILLAVAQSLHRRWWVSGIAWSGATAAKSASDHVPRERGRRGDHTERCQYSGAAGAT